jgi:hypothetical protein
MLPHPDPESAPLIVQSKIAELNTALSTPDGGFDRQGTDDLYHALDWYLSVRNVRQALTDLAPETLADISAHPEQYDTSEFGGPTAEEKRRRIEAAVEHDRQIVENLTHATERHGYTLEQLDEMFGDLSDEEIRMVRLGIFKF